MSLTLKFLSKNDAKQHILPHVKNRFSEYSIAMAMQQHTFEHVPSHEEFTAFFQEQFVEWPQDVRHYFSQAFTLINSQFKKRGIHLGEMEIPLALTTGKEYCYSWNMYGSTINITQKMGNGVGLADAVHPLKTKFSNLFILDIIKKHFIHSFVITIFQAYLRAHPELIDILCARLGYEKISFLDKNNDFPQRAPVHICNQDVKLQVYLPKENCYVDVMPIYYFNQHCKFNNEFTNVNESESQTHINCISKGFLVIEKDESNQYHPKLKHGNIWLLSKEECNDKRLFECKSTYGLEVFNPERALLELLVDYVFNPTKLNGLKGPLTDCLKLFDSYFRSSQKSEEEIIQENEKQPLLVQYRSYQVQKPSLPHQVNPHSSLAKLPFIKNH